MRRLEEHLRRSGESLIPRPLVVGAGVVMMTVVTLVAAARLTGVEPAGTAESLARTPASRVVLSFEDRTDGGIDVFRAGEFADPSAPVAEIAPGEGSFVRGVLRALARARMLAGLEEEARFELVAWQGGGLTISDPSTDAEIELGAFGPDNAAAFARLLRLASPSPKRDVASLE